LAYLVLEAFSRVREVGMLEGFARDPAWFFEDERWEQAVVALSDYIARYEGSWFDRLADYDHPYRITASDTSRSACSRFRSLLRPLSGCSVMGSVRWLLTPLLTPVAPSVAPKETRKALPGMGKGPVSWARSEGFEPPAF
jgi:hypothetical protein